MHTLAGATQHVTGGPVASQEAILFDKVTDRVRFRVPESRALKNGVLVVTYQPADG